MHYNYTCMHMYMYMVNLRKTTSHIVLVISLHGCIYIHYSKCGVSSDPRDHSMAECQKVGGGKEDYIENTIM